MAVRAGMNAMRLQNAIVVGMVRATAIVGMVGVVETPRPWARSLQANVPVNHPAGIPSMSATVAMVVGTTALSIHFTISSTAGCVTFARFPEAVTSRSNIFSNAHVGGTVILNRGLGSSRAAGDCPTSGPIRTFSVTAITLNVS